VGERREGVVATHKFMEPVRPFGSGTYAVGTALEKRQWGGRFPGIR